MKETHTISTDYTSKFSCEEHCQCRCNETSLYYVIGALSVVIVVLTIILGAVFRFFKRERNRRLAMWTVKTEDIRLEKIHWNPSETAKTPVSANAELADDSFDLIGEKSRSNSKKAKHYYTSTGYYQGRLVAVQKYPARRISLDKKNLFSDLDQIFKLNHEHVCTFYGSNHRGSFVTVLTEYCTRGSLQDLLDHQAEWDDVFKNSLIFDIVKGMLYLHQTSIGSHGNLKPSNCLIDSRFMVKLTDFGVIGHRFKIKENNNKHHQLDMDSFKKKLWTAPELLRMVNSPQEGTKKGDVYSFAIIAQEILYQKGVFYRKKDSFPAEEIIKRVIEPPNETREEFRPNLHDDDDIVIHEQWRKTLKLCWAENQKKRSDFQEIHQIAMGLQTENSLIDSLIHRLQTYSERLEEKVEEKTEQYKAEKERSDSLLYQMLPQAVANRLKVNTDVMPESYSKVTVYFSDIVGFSAICHKSKPLEVVQMLNDLYTMFDQIIDEFDVYKVETIGDAYMVVSGLPIRNGNNHAREIARMAIQLRDCVSNEFVIKHMPKEKMKLRVGIHTGPVVAGVVGLKMPRYCLFGDTVNTAARMEQNGKELKIHISPHTKEILDEFGTFDLKRRKQSVTLKGLGEWNTWWLTGELKPSEELDFIDEESASVIDVTNERNSNSKRLKQSVTSNSSTSSGAAQRSESSIECDHGSSFEVAHEENKSTFRDDAHPQDTRRGSAVPAPARYRPSCLANLSKQRRNGSLTPLLAKAHVENGLASDNFLLSSERLELMRKSNDYTAIGAIF